MEQADDAHDSMQHDNPQVGVLSQTLSGEELNPQQNGNAPMKSSVTMDSTAVADDGSNSQEQHHECIVVAQESDDSRPPAAEYKVGQVVFAIDQHDMIYEATIRRKLYGVNHQKQVVACMVSVTEAESILAQEEVPTWHYFVHYHGWNVKWDCWSPASKILAKSEESKQLTQRLQDEHRLLKDELSGKQKGKKKRNIVSDDDFLAAWKTRMETIYSDFYLGKITPSKSSAVSTENAGLAIAVTESNATLSSKAKNTFKGEFSSVGEVQAELSLQNKCLTRLYRHGDKISLPITLQKILVDSWENITQCNSVPDLPAKVTVRDALDRYLKGKGIDGDSVKEFLDSAMDLSEEAGALVQDGAPGGDSSSAQQWIDMRDGICQFFDEALPHQLLFSGEVAQLYALTASWVENGATKLPYSQVYGCEHLLRLLTRLPALLLDNATEADLRSILGKVNDFVRFLHKDCSLFTLNYRPFNEAELKERKRLEKIDERKRKRVQESDGTQESSECSSKKEARLQAASVLDPAFAA